jgi:hypothetical protein
MDRWETMALHTTWKQVIQDYRDDNVVQQLPLNFHSSQGLHCQTQYRQCSPQLFDCIWSTIKLESMKGQQGMVILSCCVHCHGQSSENLKAKRAKRKFIFTRLSKPKQSTSISPEDKIHLNGEHTCSECFSMPKTRTKTSMNCCQMSTLLLPPAVSFI